MCRESGAQPQAAAMRIGPIDVFAGAGIATRGDGAYRLPMGAGEPAELQVIATGVYEHVLRDLAAPFAARNGQGVSLIITNAGGVIAMLDANAAADVVMTSSAGIDSLAAKGRVVGATRADVGGMRLGVAVKSGTPVPDIK